MTRLPDGWLLRAIVAVAAAAWAVAFSVLAIGGISFELGGVLFRSHSAIPSLLAATLATFAAVAFGRESLPIALAWWWGAIERRGALAGAGLAALAIVIGVQWGTFAAGGSDSYCYLNQAELFARGEVHDYEAFGADPAWPGTPGAFVPAGHSFVPSKPGAMSPICPAGYPAMLALTKLAFGRTAMFWVTPLLGALAVWLTFALARRMGGPAAGVLAALLLVTSPIFIYQVVQPMSDVAATALWCAAVVAASRDDVRPLRRAALAGMLSGAALTVRPNLLPVAAVVGLWTSWRPASAGPMRWRPPSAGPMRWRPASAGLIFSAALLPGVLFVLAAQALMYGSPLRSGYGDLSALFSASHVVPNLRRYPRWVLEVHTPLVAAALLAPVLARPAIIRRTSLWLLAFVAAVFACYLPYVVFEEWWYQRFVLPALAPLLALSAYVAIRLFSLLAPAPRAVAFAALCAMVTGLYLHTAVKRDAFRLEDFEHRFRAAGEYVARLPANAAVITGHQTGSVRFYSGRTAVGWGDIPPGRLQDAIDFLQRRGRKPYLLFEAWEEPPFRTRFAGERFGSLEWPPMAEIDRTVRIYDPDDYAKYMSGEFVPTQRIVTRRK